MPEVLVHPALSKLISMEGPIKPPRIPKATKVFPARVTKTTIRAGPADAQATTEAIQQRRSTAGTMPHRSRIAARLPSAIMDPSLVELIEGGDPGDEVAVILRLKPGTAPPVTLRIVAQFGDVATARINRGDIAAARREVLSLKAPRHVTLPRAFDVSLGAEAIDVESDEMSEAKSFAPPSSSAPPGEDGKGVVVGVCDWGIDFTHANFRNADGTTRLEMLWDQRGIGDPLAPHRTTRAGC